MIKTLSRIGNRLTGGYFSGEYDAARYENRRRDVGSTIKSSDDVLTQLKRNRLTATTRDLQRNYSLVSWAIRRHLDYVTRFSFQSRTGDDSLNVLVESLMTSWSKPLNFDVAGRHGRDRWLRLAETGRVRDGDLLPVKLSSGHLQAIESDRIRDPRESDLRASGLNGEIKTRNYKHGVDCTPGGRARRYAVHRRTANGSYEFDREVRAGRTCMIGYYESFDQVRGVSPLASAANSFRDVYENVDFALAKAKLHQLFAIAVMRDDKTRPLISTTATTNRQGQGEFGRNPILWDLNQGDNVSLLNASHPSSEFQAFHTAVCAAALKALDIPYSFADESWTNFFGSRAALMHYMESVSSKRGDLREMLDALTAWRISLWVAEGLLPGPIERYAWEWVSAAMPWWKPVEDIKADVMAIDAGFTSYRQVVKERTGREFRDVVKELAEDRAIAEEASVPLGAVLKAAGWPQGESEPTEDAAGAAADR